MDNPYSEQKARYDALYTQSKARRRNFADAKGNSANIPAELVTHKETLPGGWGWSGIIKRGTTLRIKLSAKSQGIAFLAFNAADMSERLNMGDTVKIQWGANLHKGKLLYSDMGRVLASITDDSYGKHDALAGGSSAATNFEKYGREDLRSTRGNFILLAAKHGLTKSDIPPCMTFFAPVIVDASSQLRWEGVNAQAGDYVDLRAEMDILVFLSDCPHPLSPGADTAPPIDLIVWNAPIAADDFCRSASEEAIRGFENTDAYVA